MSNELTTIGKLAGQLPAHLQTRASSTAEGLSGGLAGGYPVISIRGKRFAVSEGGTREIIMRPDDPEEPASSLKVVIVAYNPHLSKVYYSGGYTEGSDEKPTCYSHNGIVPAADAEEKQAKKCAVCPHNEWGSRISENGAKGKACADSRRLAVVPIGELDRPMLLRIPAASLRDLANYGKELSRVNCPIEGVVTRLRFDNEAAYPKLHFSAEAFVTEEEMAQINDLLEDQALLDSITGAGDEAVVPAATTSEPEAKPAKKEPEVAEKPKPKTTKAAKPAPRKREEPEPEPEEDPTEGSELDDRMAAISDDLDSALDDFDD
jgi:hypothetical protein